MQKKIGIIIIIVSVLLLSGVIYIFFISDFLSRPSTGNNPVIENGKNGNSETPRVIDTNQGQNGGQGGLRQIDVNLEGESEISPIEDNQVEKKDLVRIAMSFSERFGTYSNQSSFSNINSLKILMSFNMKNWADNYIAERKARDYDSAIYYGITTKAVSSEMREYDDDLGFASINISTRRREASGTMNNYSNVFNQDILVALIKENGAWKVDSAIWQ